MRCALSFLSVLILVLGVGLAAFFIIWYTEEQNVFEECPATHFQCVEDGSCILKIKRCDDRKDCPEGSDESPMGCSDINMERLVEDIEQLFVCGENLKNQTSLEEITSRENGTNNETHFEERTTTPRENRTNQNTILDDTTYPQGCRKVEKKYISCHNTNWKNVPWDNLSLSSNAFQLALRNVLHNSTVQLIPPANNSINRIFFENNTFGVLEKVCNWDYACWLDLSNNSIDIITNGAFCSMPKLRHLILSNNKFDLKGFEFQGMPILSTLGLSKNRIEVISDDLFKNLGNLTKLTLDNNKIHTIQPGAFIYNLQLRELDLSQNRLKTFPPQGLVRQVNLHRLNLGHNPFELLPDKLFSTLESLDHLYLAGIEITAIDVESLNQLTKLDYIIFKKFSYCRYVPKVSRCFPNSDGMSSFENLLAGSSVRIMVWVVAILTLGGNLMVLLSRCFRSSRGRILDVFINNLAGADFLMGIYLLVLAIMDVQYRNSFNNYAYQWSTSLLCSGIGILGMISSEVSLLILTIMSVERYLVISGPFSCRKKLSLNLARLTMVIIWLFVTALAVAPAIQWRGKQSFYGSTGLCFPVHLDDPFSVGWQYTSFVFVGLNSTCLIIVAISYSALFCVIQKTRLSTPIVVKDMEMALRFFLMVFTDCLCWLPIIMLKIYALTGHEIPKELITWVLVFVLPINSTINPYLYTLSMGEIRMNLFRPFLPTAATGNPRRSIINLPLRRHGEESQNTWDTTNTTTNTTTGETNKASFVPVRVVAGPTRNRVSYQESIASSNVSFDPH